MIAAWLFIALSFVLDPFDAQLPNSVNLAIQLCQIGTLNAFSVDVTYPADGSAPHWTIVWWLRSGETFFNQWPANLVNPPCYPDTCPPDWCAGCFVDPGQPCVFTVWHQ